MKTPLNKITVRITIAIALLIPFLIISQPALAVDTLSSKISDVTVFLSGAQVFRKTNSFTIKNGISEVIIKDVSPGLNKKNIQATANGNFQILDIKPIIEHIEPKAAKPKIVPPRIHDEIRQLNDSILFIGFEQETINNKLSSLRSEKEMLINNRLMNGGGRSDSLAVLQEAIVYYRKKLNEIYSLIESWKKKQHYIQVRENEIRNRLNELNTFTQNIQQPVLPAKKRHHILVTLYTKKATSGTMEVNYLVPNAGWIPSYDLRAQNTSDPMSVMYKAHVYQNSGENWNHVNLTLSTFNQHCLTSKPSIGIWRIDYKIINKNTGTIRTISSNQPQFTNMISEVEAPTLNKNINIGYERISTNEEVQSVEQKHYSEEEIAQISHSFANVEFKINAPYSIKADGEQKLMVISDKEVKADFYHFVLPRVNKNGFLLAQIDEWENLDLLPGKANIYFDKTYVGETHIDPAIMQDTMELALGRDQAIISTRKKINQKIRKNPLTGKKTQEMEFEIVVRNNTSKRIEIAVEDQIPVTSNKDILIELLDSDKADYNEKSGKLIWNLKVGPNDSKKVIFKYSVKYDKDKVIA